ncbi:MAG TPA: hypothetical protein VL463_17400 [Kofleriaceae bacterium]|nr:hypothetical protein [Kofleriaceae bacterium]
MARCETAFRALGDACSAACDVVLASRTPALAAQLMDCWYIAGATARLLARHAEHPARTLAMMVAVARQVTRAAGDHAPVDPPAPVRAWMRAIREASLASTAVLGLIWDDALGPWDGATHEIEPPHLRVTQELDPDELALSDDEAGAIRSR